MNAPEQPRQAPQHYVRVCPVCGAEHPATAAQCGCGTLLAGVDLSLKSPAAPTAAGEATVVVGEETLPAGPRCPHPDCGAINPPGAERCVYCDRPLAQAAAAALELPWGERLEIPGHLVFGREGDIPDALKRRLATEFDNVSRRHAELAYVNGQLRVVDLSSANGTFVNDERLPPRIPRTLAAGDVLRFAARLAATVRIG